MNPVVPAGERDDKRRKELNIYGNEDKVNSACVCEEKKINSLTGLHGEG